MPRATTTPSPCGARCEQHARDLRQGRSRTARHGICAKIWKLYEASEIDAGIRATGRFERDPTLADVDAVLTQIEDERREAEARQRRRDEATPSREPDPPPPPPPPPHPPLSARRSASIHLWWRMKRGADGTPTLTRRAGPDVLLILRHGSSALPLNAGTYLAWVSEWVKELL